MQQAQFEQQLTINSWHRASQKDLRTARAWHKKGDTSRAAFHWQKAKIAAKHARSVEV